MQRKPNAPNTQKEGENKAKKQPTSNITSVNRRYEKATDPRPPPTASKARTRRQLEEALATTKREQCEGQEGEKKATPHYIPKQTDIHTEHPPARALQPGTTLATQPPAVATPGRMALKAGWPDVATPARMALSNHPTHAAPSRALARALLARIDQPGASDAVTPQGLTAVTTC